jgi:fatty-acid peroxygenase
VGAIGGGHAREEAARLFDDAERFQRAGAAPRRVKATLLGEGGVQSLDGEAHRRRKAMFMSPMT